MAKDLASSDAKKREEAERKLEELKNRARDPNARKAAEKLLDRQKNSGKPGERDNNEATSDEKDGNRKASEKKPSDRPAKDKDAAAEQKKAGSKDKRSDNDSGESDKTNPDQKRKDKESSDARKGSSEQTPGSGAGTRPGSQPSRQDRTGTAKRPDPEDGSPAETNKESGNKADERFQKRAGELQLENLKKKVTPDVLKDAHMTESEFQDFLKAKEAALKKSASAASAKERLAAPRQGNRNLSNQRVRRVQSTGTTPTDNAESIGPLDAPPEYRDVYREFSRQLNEQPRPADKKQ